MNIVETDDDFWTIGICGSIDFDFFSIGTDASLSVTRSPVCESSRVHGDGKYWPVVREIDILPTLVRKANYSIRCEVRKKATMSARNLCDVTNVVHRVVELGDMDVESGEITVAGVKMKVMKIGEKWVANKKHLDTMIKAIEGLDSAMMHR